MRPLLALLLLSACGGGDQLADADPCANAPGICLGLQLRDGLDGELDSLLVHVSGPQDRTVSLALGPGSRLPLAVGVLLPDGGGLFTVAVGAVRAGAVVAAAKTVIAVAGGHLGHDLHLEPFAGPRCDDGLQDGDETGIDCGGPGSCPRCGVGRHCAHGTDCQSGACAGTCQ